MVYVVYHYNQNVQLVEYELVSPPGMAPSAEGDCLIRNTQTGQINTGNRDRYSDTPEEAIRRALETQQQYVEAARQRLLNQAAILDNIIKLQGDKR